MSLWLCRDNIQIIVECSDSGRVAIHTHFSLSQLSVSADETMFVALLARPPLAPPRRRSLVLLLLLSRVACDTVGVCWTRNHVLYDLARPDFGVVADHWIQLHASALSVKGLPREVRTCLFTDAPGRVVRFAMNSFQRSPKEEALFDTILLEDDLETFIENVVDRKLGLGDVWRRIESGLQNVTEGHSNIASGPVERFVTRMKRIYNYGRAPFTATLFLDDDTVFCPSMSFIKDTLALVDDKTVRIVEHHVSSGDHPPNPQLIQRLQDCGDDPFSFKCWPASCESFYPRYPASKNLQLQGGAILVRGGSSSVASKFAIEFLTEYLTKWSNATKTEKRLGSDQPPLGDLARRRCAETKSNWTLAGLPANYNVRFFRGGQPGVLSGPVFILHDHFFARYSHEPAFFDVLHGLCHVINANLGPRLVNIEPLRNILRFNTSSVLNSSSFATVTPFRESSSDVGRLRSSEKSPAAPKKKARSLFSSAGRRSPSSSSNQTAAVYRE